jgi:translation initiation factor 2 subunit 1
MAQKYPERDELVLATVTKIMPYGAFLSLKEYEGVEAFMHISEVAPRWIKNIHEFISVGQTHVVRVHRIDLEKAQVDVSLKRVNEEEKKRKIEGVKRHTRAKKLLGVAIKNAKSKKAPEKLEEEILAQYETLYDFLEDVRDEGEKAFEGIDAKGALHDEIVGIVKKSVKKPIIEVSRIIIIKCYEPDGVGAIKSALGKVDAHYLGPGKYRVKLTAEDYKSANKKMDKLVGSVEKGLAGKDCEFSSEEEQ